MSNRLGVLKDRLGQVADIDHASELAQWDQMTKMPPRGAGARAEALATLSRIGHELFVDDETGRLLDAAERELDGSDPDGDDARLIALTRRQWEKARRVPADLAAELTRASSVGQEAWAAARAASDFAGYMPYLEHNIELARRYVECQSGVPGYDCAYDVLLDDYEPQMRSAAVTMLFAELKTELLRIIGAVRASGVQPDDRPLHATFPVTGQRALIGEVVDMMGFDPQGWRIDDTVHPFASRIGQGDVRITVRWDEHFFATGLYSAMHECGHGLYDGGVSPSLDRTPLGSVASLGMHESQSRLWENMVGRGRPFSSVLAPRIAALAGGELAQLTPDALYRAVNTIKPSFIRIEADEVTYGLHIILRFELEQALVEGTLSVADLPEAWNARVSEYFGLRVTDDADGVLQDVHWSAGLIGYFPTYALGNLIAGALWERARSELDLDDQLAAGDLGPLRDWLGVHVHRHGSKFTTAELLAREVGSPMSVAPFARYLRAKIEDVYGIDLGE
ncbi:MAG: carboxypeptidase M32 [Solirubrobacteraceae bacterium]